MGHGHLAFDETRRGYLYSSESRTRQETSTATREGELREKEERTSPDSDMVLPSTLAGHTAS